MPIRGIRGATTVSEDKPEKILEATRELLEHIIQANDGLTPNAIASIFFTATEDIRSAYPAEAARHMGWDSVPMLCAREIPVPESLPRCIRVMVHWNTDREPSSIQHVYLRQAQTLRPDWAQKKM